MRMREKSRGEQTALPALKPQCFWMMTRVFVVNIFPGQLSLKWRDSLNSSYCNLFKYMYLLYFAHQHTHIHTHLYKYLYKMHFQYKYLLHAPPLIRHTHHFRNENRTLSDFNRLSLFVWTTVIFHSNPFHFSTNYNLKFKSFAIIFPLPARTFQFG